MKRMKTLVLSDSTTLLNTYKILLSDLCEIVVLDLDSFSEPLELSVFEIVLVDISSKHLLAKLKPLQNMGKDALFILITPFSIVELKNQIDLIHKASLLLTKPFQTIKLVKYIESEVEKLRHEYMLEKKNNYLVELVELSPLSMAVYEDNGRLFYANSNYLNMNRLETEAIDKVFFDEITLCTRSFEDICSSIGALGHFQIQEEQGEKWMESSFYKISDAHIIHFVENISRQKERELRLEQSAVIFDNSAEGIMMCDSKNRVVSVNRSFSAITGYPRDEIVGKSPRILQSGIHDKSFYESMWGGLVHNKHWKGEIWNRRKNGEIYPEWLSISKIENEQYEDGFYIAIFSDISSLKEADKKIHFYANHDSLTGLANRMQFEAQLANSIEGCKRNQTKLAVVFIDLDKFKEVNDTYGHQTGDVMLKTIAKRLRDTIRAEDLLARIGGDEFVIIAKDIKSDESVKTLAKKLEDTMEKPIVIDKKEFHMTLSIGISIYPEHGETSTDIVKNADVAMYEVKENGRASFRIFKQEMTQKVTDKFIIQNELRQALKNDEFVLHYQPVISLVDSKIIGAEALIRWNHPTRGLLYPGDFLEYVEEGFMEKEIGYLVVIKALQDLVNINTSFQGLKPFVLSINVAAAQLFDMQFTYKLVTMCNDFQIDTKQIELEILETQILHNPLIAQEKFDELHALGFSIALDDFGTGYSSLNYLKTFRVDKLKIDQSFIRDMMVNDEDDAITLAVINLAKIFKMEVQAEGVESEEIYQQIKSYECDYSQGYFHSKPKPLEHFLELLHA